MTIEQCMEFCRMGRYKFAGLAFGTECLCDNRGPMYYIDRKTENANCMLPCRGDRWEACGGVKQARFYETRIGVCGGKLKPSDGYISSPLFPSEYDRGSICTWKVTRDDPNIEGYTLKFMMLLLLPGDTIRITDLGSNNWAAPRNTLLLITNTTQLEGAIMNISGPGFYVEFQSSLTTTGQGDPGFMITYTPKQSKKSMKGLTTIVPSIANTSVGIGVGNTYNPRHFPTQYFDNSMEESTTYGPTYIPMTTHAPHSPGKLVATVATVGIGGSIVAFWGISLGAMFLRKKVPWILKYTKGDTEFDDSPDVS
ncbi:uncharacterized protein [Amphiura filiformis]|uniref:uncharacterized protein n=1 Tax=Amphiura filiformis TaxID=82378 RepID=UPI003B2255EB